MISPTSNTCSELLKEWETNLDITNFEKTHLSGELKALDRQINRLFNRHIRISVFGRVGVGKSSLLNALIKEEQFATDIAHGCTRKTKGVIWKESVKDINTIELVDTPGIDEIRAKGRAHLASRIALNSDLILLVIDSDINRIEIEALESLLENGKPVLIVLNRCDQWETNEINEILTSIKNRLPNFAKNLIIKTASAAPRKSNISSDGEIINEKLRAKVGSLQETLLSLLETQGSILLTLNALRQAETFYRSLKSSRLERRKSAAQGLIGKFATIKASGIAINPLLLFDLATGLSFDTALVIQLSKLYGLELKGHSARKLLKELSIHNSLLGGVHIGIQFVLGAMQHVLLIASPFTGGLSLASAAPIAVAQAAVAVHTTRLTGRLAAEELLRNSRTKGRSPRSILLHLYKTNPNVRIFLNTWAMNSNNKTQNIYSLLP